MRENAANENGHAAKGAATENDQVAHLTGDRRRGRTRRCHVQDVLIYVTGLGTVQAYNSVLVSSRIDDQIVKVTFSDGKDLSAGDVPVESELPLLRRRGVRRRRTRTRPLGHKRPKAG